MKKSKQKAQGKQSLISSFFTKKPIEPNVSNSTSTFCKLQTVIVESDEDVIDATPVKKQTSKALKGQQTKCVLDEISNVCNPVHLPIEKKRKCSSTADLIDDAFCVQPSKRICEVASSTKYISVKSPDKLYLQKEAAKIVKLLTTPEKNKVRTPRKTTPVRTPNKSKRTPVKLFSKSPNINEFKVQVMENFVVITPSKSNKQFYLKSSEKEEKAGVDLEHKSPSSSNRSLDVQNENEHTPLKPSCSAKNNDTPLSRVKVRLDFCSSNTKGRKSITPDKNQESPNTWADMFDGSWGEELVTAKERYLLDLSEPKHCKVIKIERETRNFTLTLQCTKSLEKALCVLKDFWVSLKVEVGNILYVQANNCEDEELWTVSNEHGLVVFEPDYLVSSTSVVGAIFCKRQKVLSERYQGFEPPNKQMVVGILVHTLLQDVLRNEVKTVPQIQKILDKIMNEKSTIQKLYSASLAEKDVQAELMQFVPKIKSFLDLYVLPNTNKTSARQVINSQDWKGKINEIQDIEENIWCPELGIKGKVDVSVLSGNLMMPLELKTGRATVSLEHRGQVMLYIMMMSKLGYKVNSGILLYLREGVVRDVPISQREQRDLMLLRNDLTYYLTRRPKIAPKDAEPASENTRLLFPDLPEPINHHSACSKCPYSIICCSFLKFESVELSQSNKLRTISQEALAHLSNSCLNYFVHWSSLLHLEALHETGTKDSREIYTVSPQKREKNGKCLSNMELVDDVSESGGLYNTTFRRKSEEKNLLASTIVESNYLIVSTEKRPAVASGIVSCKDVGTITIALDRDLSKKFVDGTFHLDTYDSSSILSFNLTNLAMLLEPSEIADKLRRLVIDKEKPTFSQKLSKAVVHSAGPILSKLNRSQKRAVLKALVADDYLLINGMPGTGKTATIVALVRLLVELKQTVLITSHTHSAVDNVCIRLKKDGVNVLRLGSESRMHPDLKAFSESALTRNCKSTDDLEEVYNNAKVLAVTCLGSGHPILSKRVLDVCVVDESTQVLQPSLFRALSAAKKFILIGDPDQLPPVVRNQEALKEGLSESLFQRLCSPESTVLLNYNYRMNKPITELANALTYKGDLLIANDEVANSNLNIPQIQNLQTLYEEQAWIRRVLDRKLSSAVRIVDTGPTWNRKHVRSPNGISKIALIKDTETINCANIFESGIVATLVKALLKGGVAKDSIGVIAPYRAQVSLIFSALEKLGVDVSTVDQFQGRDKDVIIYSCTKSWDISKAFLKSKFEILEDIRRLTVAITRAKVKLILIGDLSTIKLYKPFECLLSCIESANVVTLVDGEFGFRWDAVLSSSAEQ